MTIEFNIILKGARKVCRHVNSFKIKVIPGRFL